MSVGNGDFQYEYVPGWGKGDDGFKLGVVSGHAADSQDRIYVVDRQPKPQIVVFDRDGRFLNSWGNDLFPLPHDIWIDSDDKVYVSDCGDHTIRVCTTDGEVLLTLGSPGQAGDPGMPFNQPTRAVTSPSGDIWVSDGYGQHRVHRFDADGTHLSSWGEKGSEPEQFTLVHSIFIDQQERVWIADREPNNCIKVFDMAGNLLDNWKGRIFPCGLFIDGDGTVYVAEGHGVDIFTSDGRLLTNIPLPVDPREAGHGSHSVWVDSHRDMYVGEVGAEDYFHKFARI